MSSFKRIKFNKINKRGDELVRRSEGMEVKPGEEVEKEVVAKDVDEGGWGEVVINGKVDIRDGENRDGGVVRGICTRGVAEVRREVNWESFDTMERRVLMCGERGLEKELHMKKKVWDNKKSKNINNIYFYFC